MLGVDYDVDDNNNVDDDVDHLVRNRGDEGVGPVTASQVEIATVHKVQSENVSCHRHRHRQNYYA